jgi:peptidoglycan hydrolase CwlO-like protein
LLPKTVSKASQPEIQQLSDKVDHIEAKIDAHDTKVEELKAQLVTLNQNVQSMMACISTKIPECD